MLIVRKECLIIFVVVDWPCLSIVHLAAEVGGGVSFAYQLRISGLAPIGLFFPGTRLPPCLGPAPSFLYLITSVD